MVRLLAALLLVSACAAPVAPTRVQSAASAMAPLIGCWRGVFEGVADITDEHCFEVLGDHVVDVHAVRPTPYGGETTYHLDDTQGMIVWAYAANDGGRSHGSIRPVESGFVVEPYTHRGATGEAYRLRSAWTFEGADRFVMTTERELDGAWRPFMRTSFTRIAAPN